MTGDGSERRRHARFDVMAQVRVKRGRTSLVLEVLNVSKSGAFVELGTLDRPAWVSPGKRVELIVFLSGDEAGTGVSVRTWATIVRIVESTHGLGFAVEFEHLDESDRERIAALVEQVRIDLMARQGI